MGVTGALRPTHRRPIDAVSSGYYVNPEAFAPPAAAEWGDAARNSITGPVQFSLNAGIMRTFIVSNRLSLDWRIDATNVLNRVVYSSVTTTVGSPQFGLPDRANPMRKIQSSVRLRF